MTLETYDIVMLVVLIGATLLGAAKGLAWQVASLASLIASYLVAYEYREPVSAWIPIDAPWSIFLAMLILFMGTSFVVWFVFRLVARFIDRMKLKEFDRQIGALLGLLKGALLCVIITLFAITLLGEEHRKAIVRSRSGYYIAVLLNRSHAVLPNEIHEVIGPYLDAFERRLDPNSDPDLAEGEDAEAEAAEPKEFDYGSLPLLN